MKKLFVFLNESVTVTIPVWYIFAWFVISVVLYVVFYVLAQKILNIIMDLQEEDETETSSSSSEDLFKVEIRLTKKLVELKQELFNISHILKNKK